MGIRVFVTLLLLSLIVACATPATPGATPAPATPQPTTPPVPGGTSAPVGTPPSGDVMITFHRTGGVAGLNETYTLKPDGTVDSSKGPKTASGGVADAVKLASAIAATGIYSVAPGKYLPDNACCDRFTYDITLSVGGKSYAYTTMDGTQSAPPALLQTVGLISQYVANAK